jgi:4-hydroxyphenylpyruvate dioxygenase
MPLHGIDHLELWVGNAAQAAYVFTHAFGFTEIAYAGLETGLRDCTSHVLQQGRIRLVVTGALGGAGPIAEHHRAHGDGVKVVALGVPDVAAAYREATARGAQGELEPYDLYDEHGTVRLAEIAAYGDTVHRFVERGGYDGPFMPGYVAVEHEGDPSQPALFAGIDHVVANVELELIHFSDEAISTEYSALMSKVVTSGDGRVKFPINEPAASKRRSQIDEYLDYYGGPGVQHVAVSTTDIVATVTELARRGVRFLRTPDSYYAQLPERIGEIDESIDDLRRLGILVDRDDEGYLLQIFTKPLGDRPTIFFEIIERHGARGFGEGNFKALFEAIEREQALRGNL